MASTSGFRYSRSIESVLEPWRTQIDGSEFDQVVALLGERDRELEDYLSQFGPQVSQITTSETTTSATFTDLATVGPTVTVKVQNSGLLMVQIHSNIIYASTAMPSQMSFNIVNSAGTEVLAAAAARCAWANIVLGGVWQFDLALDYQFLVTGLAPGTYTVKMKYRQTSVGTSVQFGDRVLVAQPL